MIFHGNSDIGHRRQINQDCFVCMPIWGGEAVLLVVCDGMGGHKAGEIASQKAIAAFCDRIVGNPCFEENPQRERDAVMRQMVIAANEANRLVYKLSHEHEELAGMGTTLVASIVYNNIMYTVNVGDSRAYIVTKREAMQITQDHSFVQYLIKEHKLTPEEAKHYPQKNVITRAIGINEKVDVDFFSANLVNWGTGYLLLCSDGLSNYMESSDMIRILCNKDAADRAAPKEEMIRKTDQLIALANDRGGADNITAVIAKF